MSLARFVLLAASPLALAACTATVAQPEVAGTVASQTEHDRLFKLFADSDEASLRRNPLTALFRGDLRYADQLGDLFSEEHAEAEYQAYRAELAALRRIDRRRLSATDRVAYDVFEAQKLSDIKATTPEIRRLTDVRPLDHFYGAQTWYPDLASGQGAAPFGTVADYENNIKRHRQFAQQLDVAIARFREGMKTGVVQPKLVVRNMIDQLDLQLEGGVEGSAFYAPLKQFPAAVPVAERSRLTEQTTVVIRDDVFPAYRRLRDFLANEYLPVARDSVGLVGMPGGLKLYTQLVERNTTLPMTPDEVHKLGLSEVTRIKSEMEAVKAQTGFTGTLPQFFEYLRTDPRFRPATRNAMRQAFEEIGRRVDARVREQFSTIPSTLR